MRTIGNLKIAVFLLKFTIITALIFWSGIGIADSTAGAVAPEGRGNDVLRIIYSGGLTGNIEPCG